MIIVVDVIWMIDFQKLCNLSDCLKVSARHYSSQFIWCVPQTLDDEKLVNGKRVPLTEDKFKLGQMTSIM